MAGPAGELGWLLHSLLLIERELLLFAGFWIVVGLADELAIDLTWLWLRLTGRARTGQLPAGYGAQPLAGPLAVLIPAYAEAPVIGTTVAHILGAWPQAELRLYVGCYRNDPPTIGAVIAAAGGDPRLRLVIHGSPGPTTKADCLNRLYAALCIDERRSGRAFRGLVLHDAEDMVHPAGLTAIDAALDAVDFVQLPVHPVIPHRGSWVAGHYADEFTESHAKALVVRSALGLSLPAAGVGCGLARAAVTALAADQARLGQPGPFSPEALTEDYELGLTLSRRGRGGVFLRLRDAEGGLVATRSCFPDRLAPAVRQKTLWIHGIAFQGWDRLGWTGRPLELWMALRDRRGLLTALVLAAAYLLLLVDAVLLAARLSGWQPAVPLSPVEGGLLALGLAGLVWRAGLRVVFVSREYGWVEGLRSLFRIPIANVVAIMAGRRALVAYVRSLAGGTIAWDKTDHQVHPALLKRAGAAA